MRIHCGRGRQRRRAAFHSHRRLRCEPLESRWLLAVLTVTSNSDAGPGSLRDAIAQTNATPEADVINFAFTSGLPEIRLSSTELQITGELEIDGSSYQDGVTISALDADPTPGVPDGQGIRVFSIENESQDFTVSMKHLNVVGGDVAGAGGGIFSSESLTLVDSRVEQNFATESGGGIEFMGLELQLNHSAIHQNQSGEFSGGGLRAVTRDEAAVTLQSSTVSGNTAGTFGGGIEIFDLGTVQFQMYDTTVEDNVAQSVGSGGGLFIYTPGSVNIDGSVFQRNVSPNGGGGMVFSTFGGSTQLTGTTFRDNQGNFGGGLFLQTIDYADTRLTDVTVEGNTAFRGGGISAYTRYGAEITIERTIIDSNTATDGGGLLIEDFYGGSTTVQDSVISGNQAMRDGGGAYVQTLDFPYYYNTTSAVLQSTTVSGNSAARYGGGIFAETRFFGDLQLDHVTIAENLAEVDGGGMFVEDGPFVPALRSTMLADNVNGAGEMNDLAGTAVAQYSLIESHPSGTLNMPLNNILNVDPRLGPLQNNGGPTSTHAIGFGSRAIDAGQPTASSDFDQRGTPFARLVGGATDIGAYESQDPAAGDFNFDGQYDCDDINALGAAIGEGSTDLSFDLNLDGTVNLDDLAEWLSGAGRENLQSQNAYLLGDANLDGVVDGFDFIIWNQHKFTSGGRWCRGDFNADLIVDGLDFIIWNQNKFQSSLNLPNDRFFAAYSDEVTPELPPHTLGADGTVAVPSAQRFVVSRAELSQPMAIGARVTARRVAIATAHVGIADAEALDSADPVTPSMIGLAHVPR